jgi:preprotein translocase subunit YajC
MTDPKKGQKVTLKSGKVVTVKEVGDHFVWVSNSSLPVLKEDLR